jgi:ABC-type bacteriocin/lantibiotic exporter with double-glycine peptidase domain
MVRYQSRKSSCGPAALQNAIEPLSYVRSEDELAKLCGTTSDGTSETGIKKALKALDIPFSILSQKSFDTARMVLYAHLHMGGTAIISVDSNSHWVAVVGIAGYKYIVIDSADENLVVFWDGVNLDIKWKGEGLYYGILTSL